jgi:hypothetical protein
MRKLLYILPLILLSCQKDLEEPTPIVEPTPVRTYHIAKVSTLSITSFAVYLNNQIMGEPYFMDFGVYTNDTIKVRHKIYGTIGTVRIHIDGVTKYEKVANTLGQHEHIYIVE